MSRDSQLQCNAAGASRTQQGLSYIRSCHAVVSKQNVGREDQMQRQHGVTGPLLVMAGRDDSKVLMKPPQACGIVDPM